MDKKTGKEPHSWKLWALPFIIGGGMGFGSLLGIASFSHDIHEKSPAGDFAGAAGALIVMLCLLTGFGLAFVVIVLGKLMRPRSSGSVALRLILSVLGGIAIGALGVNEGTLATAIFWCLLTVLPVLLAWSWQKK
ncbi:MAG: hypothetical protein PHI97_35205 [Desulfobulbus sp.]|nr:hypothetical protein [Desulfobulbus sp.]